MNNKTLTKAFGSKETACSAFGYVVFTMGTIRNYLFLLAIWSQPHGASFSIFDQILVKSMVPILGVWGASYVFFSMKKLGFYGTYHGDHFGIFHKEKLTVYPFNVCEHPMYLVLI